MSDLKISPIELFKQNSDDIISLCINGIDTFALELEDAQGKYLAIPALDKRLNNICGQIIHGHFITKVLHDKYKGIVSIIKAYY